MSAMYFYINSSDHIVVNKRLTLYTRDDFCSIIEDTNISTPVLKLSKDINPHNYNYVYIPEFNRYYYAEEPPEYKAGFYTIKLKVDVLMSFRESFLEEDVVIDRSESNYNLYLPDEQIKLYGYQYYQTKKMIPETDLKFAMETEQFVLNCAGGV